jgi:hypothetical protein
LLNSAKTKIVYQTLEDRGTNADEVERQGPYLCDWPNSWLGDGYYFWDTFIENAHWWGSEVRKFNDGYLICKAECDFNTRDCLDLHGDLEQLQIFKEAFNLMKLHKVVDNSTTVRNFLAKLRGQLKEFNKFKAIRVNGIKSKTFASHFTTNLFFENRKSQYFELVPAVQICFFAKTSLNLRNYRIVFPSYYANDYVV